MRHHFGRKILSTEEEDLNNLNPAPEATTTQDVAVAKAGQELAEAVVEQTESEVEGEARVDELATGGEIVEALESLAVLVGDAAKGQGLGRDAAASVQIQFDFYRRKLGDTGPSKMPSLESFGATSSKIRGTVASLEEITDLAKRAWKAIVEKVKAAFKWIRDHFLKIFGSAEKLKKRAEALKAKAEGLASDLTMKEKTFENEALAKKLFIGGSMIGGTGAVEAAKKFNAIISDFVNVAPAQATKLTEAVESGLKSETAGSEFTSDNIGFPKNFAETNVPGSRKNDTSGLMVVHASEQLPGGKAIVAMIPGAGLKGEDALSALSKTKVVVDPMDGVKAPTAAKIDTLDRGPLGEVADQISKLAEALVQSRSATDNAGKKRDALERQLDSFAREFEKADGAGAEGKKKTAAAAKALVTKLPTVVDFGMTRVFSEGVVTGNAFLDWVQLSLKQFAKA